MKRGVTFLLLLFLLLPFASASEAWILNAREVQLTTEIHQKIDFIKNEMSRVGLVRVNTTLFPKISSRQRIPVQFAYPNTTRKNDRYVFEWRLPPGDINYSVYASISNQFIIKEVTKKVAFPLKEVPRGYEDYVQETQLVDFSNSQIKELASELAEGEDDLYELLFKIGVWVHRNIDYSFEPEVRDTKKSASWVLANHRGACDEFSALFMALARALNIPVRYVTGQAFSNDEEEPWQLHGWVEAYFPVYGWIPFDPTFGQLGFIDNSHIEYMYSVDVGKSPASLTYDAVDTNFSIEPPVIITEVIGSTDSAPRLLDMKVEPFKSTVGLKSYNLITVVLNNTKNFYVPVELTLGMTEGLTYMDSRDRLLLLRPKEAAKEFFVLATNATLSDRYAYTFPVRVYTATNQSASSSFESKRDFEELSYDRVNALVEQLQKEQTVVNKTQIKDISLECAFIGNQSYQGDRLPFNCTVHNMGNTALKDIQICSKSGCAPFSLGIQERKYFRFEEKYDEAGDYDSIFSVEGPQISKSAILSISVLPLPSIGISSLDIPESVRFKDKFKIVFLLENTVNSPVRDVVVNLSSTFLHTSLPLQDFQIKKLISIESRGRDLQDGNNTFKLRVSYKDLDKRVYRTEKEFKIFLEKPNFVQRIPIWIREFFNWLDGLFEKKS